MDLYIYGAGKAGKEALADFESCNDGKYQLNSFIDRNFGTTYKSYKICSIEEVDSKDAVIVVAVRDLSMQKEIYCMLYSKGYRNLFLYLPRLAQGSGEDFLEKCCISMADWGEEILPRVEMHISDWCNLNCRGCTHFSPIFSKDFPDFEDRIKDVVLLKEKFSHIIRLDILGGEPLLNPEIGKYCTRMRELLPTTDLWLVTNGLLIPKLSEDILKLIKENHILICISEYEPTHKIIDKIVAILNKAGICYNLRPYDIKTKFNRPLSLSSNSKYPKMCISNGCVNIYKGKIARCPTLMYIDEFNQKFGTNLPNDGIISLDDDIRGNELLQSLQEEVPLCKHCVKNEIEWSSCGNEPMLSDFASEK